jgi:hypothetical protein
MKKWIVFLKTSEELAVTVEAETEDEALQLGRELDPEEIDLPTSLRPDDLSGWEVFDVEEINKDE